jgi:hypothetical protein
MINNKNNILHNKDTRTMRDATMLPGLCRMPRDGQEDMDHTTLENEATTSL